VRPDRCGYGRALGSLTPGDREAVEQFRAYLEGRVALAADRRTYVPLDSPEAVHVAPPPDCHDMWHFSRGEATGPCPTCGHVETWTEGDEG